jgi:tetratricopeptide (TPR) repeat protein
MAPLTVVAFLVGIIVDRRCIKQGVSSEKDLAWSGADPSGSSQLPGGLSLISFFRHYGWKGAQSVKNYLLERRSFSLNKKIRPQSPQLAEWREQLIAKRKLIEDEGKVHTLQSIQNELFKQRRKSARYRRMIAFQILIGLLFLLPSLLYLVVGVFPNTHRVLDIFNYQIVFYLISGLGVICGILLLARMILFYRGYSSARRSLSGQALGSYLLGGVVAHGALLVLLAGLALGFLGGPTATPIDLLHISENLDIVLFIDLVMLVFALTALFFPLAMTFFPWWFLLFFELMDLWITVDTIMVLHQKGEENLTQLERLELMLAYFNILFDVDDYLDVGMSFLDIALDVMPEPPGPVDWSRPRQIQGAFAQIRRGDVFAVDQRYVDAQRSYQKARDLIGRGRATTFSTMAVEERLGDVLKAQGKNREALEAYQKALQQLPSERSAPGYQADLLVKIGDQQAALSEFEAAQESYQSALTLAQAEAANPIQLAEIMLKMGEVWLQLGEGEQTLQILGKIFDLLLQESPSSLERADLFVELGEAYLKLADRELAQRCFQHGLEDYQALGHPLSEELLERLDQLD